jgi:hypothetical protein
MIVRPLSAHRYYRRTLRDADDNFEHRETTLSHTLRRPHASLGGRSYGDAFYHALAARAGVRTFRQVLELGGGRGDFARGFLRAWRRAAARRAGAYTILDLAPALLRSQRRVTGSGAVRLLQADAQRLPLRTGSFDGLVIANEMIADLDAWEVTRRGNGALRVSGRAGARHADAVRDDFDRYGLGGLMRHPSTLVPIGVVRMLEELHRVITPSTRVVLTEYFDVETGGRVNQFDGHAECAFSLDLVCALAQRIGFSVRVMALSDFLDLRVTVPVMTTRFGSFLREVLGYDVSMTDPRTAPRLRAILGPKFRGERDGWCSRAELQDLASAFHVLLLTKRRLLDPARLDASSVLRREPQVRLMTARDGRRLLATAWPLSCRALNDTGMYVWHLLDGRRTAGQIAQRLAARHRVSGGRALRDTLAFLRAAARARYVH